MNPHIQKSDFDLFFGPILTLSLRELSQMTSTKKGSGGSAKVDMLTIRKKILFVKQNQLTNITWLLKEKRFLHLIKGQIASEKRFWHLKKGQIPLKSLYCRFWLGYLCI